MAFRKYQKSESLEVVQNEDEIESVQKEAAALREERARLYAEDDEAEDQPPAFPATVGRAT
jgi:hypothetical protein